MHRNRKHHPGVEITVFSVPGCLRRQKQTQTLRVVFRDDLHPVTLDLIPITQGGADVLRDAGLTDLCRPVRQVTGHGEALVTSVRGTVRNTNNEQSKIHLLRLVGTDLLVQLVCSW